MVFKIFEKITVVIFNCIPYFLFAPLRVVFALMVFKIFEKLTVVIFNCILYFFCASDGCICADGFQNF